MLCTPLHFIHLKFPRQGGGLKRILRSSKGCQTQMWLGGGSTFRVSGEFPPRKRPHTQHRQRTPSKASASVEAREMTNDIPLVIKTQPGHKTIKHTHTHTREKSKKQPSMYTGGICTWPRALAVHAVKSRGQNSSASLELHTPGRRVAQGWERASRGRNVGLDYRWAVEEVDCVVSREK